MSKTNGPFIQKNPAPMTFNLFRHAFIEHTGAQSRKNKLDQRRLDFSMIGFKDGIQYRGSQRQSFDALPGPIRADLGAGDPPDFFGIGFKENLEQPTPKLSNHPILETDRRDR